MRTSSAIDGAKQATIACNAAQQVIENVRSYKGAKVANGTYANTTVFGPVPQISELSGGTATLTIATYSGSLKRATVTVGWRANGNAQSRSMTQTTLISAGGVAP